MNGEAIVNLPNGQQRNLPLRGILRNASAVRLEPRSESTAENQGVTVDTSFSIATTIPKAEDQRQGSNWTLVKSIAFGNKVILQ